MFKNVKFIVKIKKKKIIFICELTYLFYMK